MQIHATHDDLLAALDAGGPHDSGWAATDADGTLWAADVADEAYQLLLRERLLRPAAAPALGRLVEAAGEPPSDDPHTNAQRIYDLYLVGKIDDWPVLEAMTACYAGWSVPEVRTFAQRVYRELIASHVYASTVPLLQGLVERGLSLVVVSGSPGVLVEEAVRCLGFEVPVRGVQIQMQGDLWGDQLRLPITWEQGKVDALHLMGAGAPVISFGDTLGDLALLQAATHVRVLVHPRPNLQHAARAHGGAENGWCLLSPKTTVDGRKITTPESDRTIV